MQIHPNERYDDFIRILKDKRRLQAQCKGLTSKELEGARALIQDLILRLKDEDGTKGDTPALFQFAELDGTMATWNGTGEMPFTLRRYLAAGKLLDDFKKT